MSINVIRAQDGTPLHIHRWPGQGTRGTVLIVHGLGEHGGRYAEVAAWLSARGFRVLGYDHRGHGRSGGPRGVIPTADALVDDLAVVMDVLRPAQGPFVLLGHSMGGAVAAQFVAQARRHVDGLVLSSPALAAKLSRSQRVMLAIGLAVAPFLTHGNGIDANDISHEPEVVQRYLGDPLNHNRVCARLAKSVLDGGEIARAAAAGWSVPTLLVYAGADALVDPAGSDAFAASAPREVVESERFPGLFHEILNEGALAAPVFARIERWLDAHVPA